MRVFLPAGTHLPWRVTGMGKFYTRWRIWIRVMSKIKGDGYGYGVVPPAPIHCGCHPYSHLTLWYGWRVGERNGKLFPTESKDGAKLGKSPNRGYGWTVDGCMGSTAHRLLCHMIGLPWRFFLGEAALKMMCNVSLHGWPAYGKPDLRFVGIL
jgi:hypothetical protein